MVARRLRVGMIGAGHVAVNAHLPAYQALPDRYEVVAVADSSADRRDLAQRVTGLAERDCHSDARSLLDRDDLDVVDICTPQHLRKELALGAFAGGRHVLSEKPIATTPADAAEMVAAARSADVRYGIMHNYLFYPETRRALEIIASGEIGPVEVAILNWLSVWDAPGTAAYRPTWRHDPRESGGGVLMDMLHIVYLAEALLGRRLERVSAWVDARADDAPVEDLTLSRFETARNAALVNVGWGIGPGGYALSGPEGRIEVTYQGGASGAFAPVERIAVHTRAGHRDESIADLPSDDPMVLVLEDLHAAIDEHRDPIAPGEQGAHILEATLAVYLSAALGETVRLPLQPGHPVYERGVLGLRELDLPDTSHVRRRRIFGVGTAERVSA